MDLSYIYCCRQLLYLCLHGGVLLFCLFLIYSCCSIHIYSCVSIANRELITCIGLFTMYRLYYWLIWEDMVMYQDLLKYSHVILYCRVFMSKYCKSLKISDDPFDKPPCRGCSSYLTEPYIKCAECGPSHFLLCLQVNMSHTCRTHVTHMHECSQSHCLFPNLTILLMETFASSVSPGDLNTRSIKVITDMK